MKNRRSSLLSTIGRMQYGPWSLNLLSRCTENVDFDEAHRFMALEL